MLLDRSSCAKNARQLDVHGQARLRYAHCMNVLAIPGSLRRDSRNRQLLQAAAACAPTGVSIHVHEHLASIPLFDEDVERAPSGPPPAVVELRRRVDEADGLLIATPEYNQSIPGVLKNAIDWLSREAPHAVLAGKPVAVIGASGGRWGTRLAQSALRQVLFATESRVLPAPALYVSQSDRLVDEAGRLVDRRMEDQLRALLTSFAAWIQLVNGRADAAFAGVRL
jgi:chromate reductase